MTLFDGVPDMPDQWLTVTEAAARIGVSEKTLRKRIASGIIDAEKIPLDGGGWKWRVSANRLEAVGSVTEVSKRAVGSLDKSEAEEENPDVPTASNRVTEVPSVEVPTVPTVASDARYVAQLETENAFLRSAIEQHQRSEAELRAALRRALDAMPKQLTAEDAPDLAPRSATQTKADSGTPSPANASQVPARREPRPFWKVVLGVR